MELTDEEKKMADDYVVDLKTTVLTNMPLLMGFIALLYFITALSDVINQFTLPEMRLIGGFILAYVAVKTIIVLIGYSGSVHYKRREQAKQEINEKQ